MDTPKREALRKGESKAMGESCWVWTSVSPWGSLRKMAEDKAPEMRAQTGAKCSWTLPCSPAQKHPTQCTGPMFQEETLPVIQLCKGPQISPAQLILDLFRQISNLLIQYDIGLHVFVAIFLMCQGFEEFFLSIGITSLSLETAVDTISSFDHTKSSQWMAFAQLS